MGTALAGIGMALSLVSTGAGVMGSIQQANAQNSAIDAQNAANRYNATVAGQNAEMALDSANKERELGRKDLATHQLKLNKLLSGQSNDALGAGIALNSGSLNDIKDDSLLFSGIDEDAIVDSAENKAYQHEVDAFNYQAKSTGYNMAAANNNKVSAAGAVVGGIASGVGKSIKTYYGYQQAGKI